jgi:hypothetical protein
MRRELLRTITEEGQIQGLCSWVGEFVRRGLPGGEVQVTIGRPRRSLDQNSKLWPMLGDVSEQVDWHGQRLDPSEWKDVFSAALRNQKVVPGIEGGFVVLGQSTSRMSVREFADLIELIYAFGAEHDVRWTEPERVDFELQKARRALARAA